MSGECLTLFTVGRLRDLLIEDKKHLQKKLLDPVNELEKKLTMLEDLFEDAAVRRDERTSSIVDLCDQMMDAIDIYVHVRLTTKFGLRLRLHCRKLLPKIQQLDLKIADLINTHKGKTILKVGEVFAPQSLNEIPRLDEQDFVGRGEDIKSLLSRLKEVNDNRVVSICGMGGLGKTTLAKKVYKHEDVKRHFESFAFLCLGQNCDVKATLGRILQELHSGEDKSVPGMKDAIKSMSAADVEVENPNVLRDAIKSMSAADVEVEIQNVLREKRSLVVLDDIWEVDAWKGLSSALSTIQDVGGKVLITTRDREVAEFGDNIVYHLKCLSDEESWELVQRKVCTRIRGRDEKVYTRMEEIGKEMTGWCKGNPLAVRVLRGVLVTMQSLPEWERVHDNWSKGKTIDDLKEVEKVLILSYNELPYHLKPCFVYLCKYMEDEVVRAETLYLLWNAEGMIRSRDRKEGETMIDVAERYLGELIWRCMIETDESVSKEVRRFKNCRLHDLMRELCSEISRKEHFLKLTVVDSNYKPKPKPNIGELISNPSDAAATCRHAIVFGGDREADYKLGTVPFIRSLQLRGYGKQLIFDPNKFKLLRVLELFYGRINLSEEIGNLTHLRLFSVYNIREVPPSLGKLRNLQTLDLRDAVTVSNVLWKLEKLKHLFLPYRLKAGSPRLRLKGLHELETLVSFDPDVCDVKDLKDLTNLRKLKAKVNMVGNGKEGFEDLKLIIDHIKGNVNQLRHSSLHVRCNDLEPGNDHVLEQQLSGCQWILHELRLDGLKAKKLPELWKDNGNNQTTVGGGVLPVLLTYVDLFRCRFEQDPMPTLEKLSNLETLTLDNVGEITTNCSASGFPKLRHLQIRLTEIEKWRIEEGALPNLSKLDILDCSMKMLPEGLQYVTSLQELYLRGMDNKEELQRRIQPPDGEDFYKIQHIPNVTITGKNARR